MNYKSCHVGITNIIIGMLIFFLTGCDVASKSRVVVKPRTFHQKFGLKADAFFKDTLVVQLCEAIERDDLPEMQRLIDRGADVNTHGKDNVTPLFWAYPDNKPERFELLLKAGADPNVKLTGDLGVASTFDPDDSVTWLAAKSFFPKHFDLVMQYGGDAKMTDKWGNPLIHELVFSGAGDVKTRVKTLMDHGADIHSTNTSGSSLITRAIVAGANYDLALYFLDLGVDPSVHGKGSIRPIHALIQDQETISNLPQKTQQDFYRLFNRVVDAGEDPVAARREMEQWKKDVISKALARQDADKAKQRRLKKQHVVPSTEDNNLPVRTDGQ